MSKKVVVNIITNTRKILANNIVYFRIQRNLTQEDLAELLKTSPVYISQMENAKRNISCDYIDHIAKVFDIEPVELLKKRATVDTRRIDRRSKR